MRGIKHFIAMVCIGLVALSLSATVSQAQFPGAEPVPESLAPGFDSITAEQAKTWLSVLAGPTFEGRGTGQLGYTKAAHWIAGKVAEFGLEPRGEGSTYFQMLPMTRATVDSAVSKMTGPNGLEIPCKDNFGLERFAGQTQVTGKVVFLQIGGEQPSFGEENTLRDKIVIYIADDAASRRAGFLLTRQGPAAAFRVSNEAPRTGSQLTQSGGRQRATGVSGTITVAAAEKILKAVDGKLEWLEQPTAAGIAVHDTNGEVTLDMRIREESAAVPNVIAWLEGSDPALKDEYIVIGAHLDHLGSRGGAMYPGADDNGSGSTAILSIARALATNPVKPKRSVLFIWFAAEEIGLVGSRHYCDNPILPIDKMVCMLNIDMVGRNEEKEGETAEDNKQTIHLIGSKQGQTELHDAILEANKYVNFTFEYDEESVFGRSDQASFYNKGIPVAFLFGGFHPDYHQPSDKVEKIDFDKIASAARLNYMVIFGAAEHGQFKLKPKEETPTK